MPKPIMLSTLTAMMILQAPLTGLASAQTDAEKAVIEGQIISLSELQKYGHQYAADFISAYHYDTATYQQAYQSGVADCRNHLPYRPPQSRLGQIGYQRGWQHMQGTVNQAQQANNQSNNPSTSDHSEPDLAATEHYSRQEPTLSQSQFINHLAKLAQRLGKQDDLYPSVIIAQAALESNWGCSELSRAPYHNLFGVKANGRGDTILAPTSEYFEGNHQQVKDRFRVYDSDWAALLDYGETLADPLYHDVHRSACSHYRQATRALLGKYATDPEYDRKLNRLIDQYDLTKYDQPLRESAHAKSQPLATEFRDSPERDISHQSAARPKHHYPTPIISVMGGAGTAGLFQLVRRFFFK